MAQAENPRDFGEGLRSNFAGLWRYRVGDYGVVCRMEDDRLVVLVVRVGHRREVYG
jgi:mRNA interferase RelE/StbE